MPYLTGDRRFEFEIDIERLARDLSRALPATALSIRSAWSAAFAFDGVSVTLGSDSGMGLVEVGLLPEGIDFRVTGALSPVEEEIAFTLDPRMDLPGIERALRERLAAEAPRLDAQRAFASRRKRVADGPGNWMGVIRIDGKPLVLRPGGGWDWYVPAEGEAQGHSYFADHDPANRAGETLFFEIVQWFLGRGDNPDFPRPLTPDQIARADCLCSRTIMSREEGAEADRAETEGRVGEWVKVVPLPPLCPIRPEETRAARRR